MQAHELMKSSRFAGFVPIFAKVSGGGPTRHHFKYNSVKLSTITQQLALILPNIDILPTRGFFFFFFFFFLLF